MQAPQLKMHKKSVFIINPVSIFLNIIRIRLGKAYSRFLYNWIYYSEWSSKGLLFFNLGVSPVDEKVSELPQMNLERFQAQVYYEIIKSFQRHSTIDKPFRILEVSVGLGGGLIMFSRFFPEAILLGLDHSKTSVSRSKKSLCSASLVVADAHSIPFAENNFSLIANVESFHALDANKFLSEASRLLDENGLLIIIDFRLSKVAPLQNWLESKACQAGLEIIEFLDLTDRVVRASKECVERREKLLRMTPSLFHGTLNEMMAGEGSNLRRQFESGEKTYFLCALKRTQVLKPII